MAGKKGGTAPGNGPVSAYKIPTRGPVTPREIYALLLQKGLSTTQAIGVMANMWAESKLNPESGGTDSNGFWAGGLISWNSEGYTNAHQLVTGNPQVDVRAQIAYLFSSTSGLQQGLKGSTPADVAGNFAANVEKCVGCEPGSTYSNGWAARRGYTRLVSGWVNSGKWPKAGASSVGPGGGGGAGSSGGACLVSLPLVGCALTTSKARALIGGGMILAALPVGLIGAITLTALGFRRTGAGPAVARTAEATGGAVAAIPGAEGIGAAIAAAGSAERRRGQAKQRAAAERKQESQQRAQGRHDEAEYKRARARGSRASATRQGPPDLDKPPF